jgi:cytochrome c peroxidase
MRSLVLVLAVAACGDNIVASDEIGLTATERFGKHLFEDEGLSEPRGQSCASCHDPGHGFASADAVAHGSHAELTGSRNAPSVLYASFVPAFAVVDTDEGPTPTGGLFWDGRADDFAQQAAGPLLNPVEMANADEAMVVAKVRQADYADLIELAPDNDAAFAQLTEAIAAYEQTELFRPFTSRFDDYLRGEAELSPVEARGLALFRDPEKGNCIACHAADTDSRDPRDWLFTDFTYDALGIPRNAAIPANADATHFDLGLGARLADPTLDGAFRVPGLRDVALTAPYGHNGYFATLRDVVAFYATRDVTPARWYPGRPYDDLPQADTGNVNTDEVPYRPLDGRARLDDDEIDAIVAFLETLTDR